MKMSSFLPLEGIKVADFSQFLSGPSATLRMADLGAEVIKIEHPIKGDLCRDLYISNVSINGESTLFHSINRNKKSIGVNLKDEASKSELMGFLSTVDVVVQNFRPGVMERLGFDYESIKAVNPSVIYCEITGYGKEGEWSTLPGQDLLAQSRSGLVWLSGDGEQGPVPMGLAIADIFAGAHAVQGILACLVRKFRDGIGGKVEVSLLESCLDIQFEVLTTYFNDGGKLPNRSKLNNAHAYLSAPYGIYQTSDGYLALAMGSITSLASILNCSQLLNYPDEQDWFIKRDEIKLILKDYLIQKTTTEWLSLLEPEGYWCAEVLDWNKLVNSEGFDILNMTQEIFLNSGHSIKTTRCPIKIDGKIIKHDKGAPDIGENNHEFFK